MSPHLPTEETAPDRGLTPIVGIAILLSVVLVAGGVLALATVSNVAGEFDDAERAAAQQTVSGNQWSGSLGDLIRLSNSRAGAHGVRARINFTIEANSNVVGDELESLTVQVDGGNAMFRKTSMDSVESITVDSDGDGATDRVLTDDATDWSVERNGRAATVEFDTTYDPDQGDSVVMVVDDIANPEAAGSYGVRARANGKGKWHHGEVTITQPVAPTG